MRLLSGLLVLGSLLLGGCSAPVAKLPPISPEPTGNQAIGQVIWHDLATRDLEIAKAFYGQLFNWEFEKIGFGPREYTVIRDRGRVIGGMFKFAEGEKENSTGEWLVNLSTDDVDEAVGQVVAAGGRIIEPVRDVPDRGRAAFVSDDQEALFVITQSSSGTPEDGVVPYGNWLWNELWTRDASKAKTFYAGVFDYAYETPTDGPSQRTYALMLRDGRPRAGMLELQVDDVRPHWVPFIRVPDVAATVTLAKAMQANVILEPDPEIRNGTVALLQGPTGEPFVVQSYEFE